MAKTNHWGALAVAAGTLVVVGLVVLLMVVLEAHPAGATFPGNPGKIAYSGHHAQDFEIYTIDSGGGGKVQLTDNAANAHNPSYSPSAKKIVYSGYDGQDFEIYIINSGGGGRFNVTDNSTDDDGGLSYSPSAKKIAYSGKDAPIGDYEIYKIDTGGGGRVKVTDNSTEDYYPSWGSS
jgi:Tol biopolymer transport system component